MLQLSSEELPSRHAKSTATFSISEHSLTTFGRVTGVPELEEALGVVFAFALHLACFTVLASLGAATSSRSLVQASAWYHRSFGIVAENFLTLNRLFSALIYQFIVCEHTIFIWLPFLVRKVRSSPGPFFGCNKGNKEIIRPQLRAP